MREFEPVAKILLV